MKLNVVDLSFNVVAKICKFLPVESISQLRKVSKSINEQVCDLVKILTTYIDSISFLYKIHSCEPQQSYSLLFMFKDRKSFFTWKLCLINVVNERIMLRTDKELNSIELDFKPENAKTALQCLKPFVIQVKLCELFVNRHIKSEILEIFLELVAEKSFKEIILLGNCQAKTFDFALWTAWFRKKRTTHVDFDPLPSINKDTVDLLYSAANVSSSLTLMFDIPISKTMVLSIAQGVLSRQCDRLTLYLEQRLSQDCIENLIQLIHHFDKKVEFGEIYDGFHFPMDYQVGICRVLQDDHGYSIRHVEKEF